MRINPNNSKRGFSLVELLLTLVLILCLAAASVFTFTAIYRSANLDEGYNRFESLIRFAQAEAATTGRKVRLQFEARPAGTNSEEKTELRNIKVTWEADLLNAPGVFQEYTNKAWSEGIVNELVGVTKVQTGSATAATEPPTEPAPAASGEEAAAQPGSTGDFPAITFYPDGSCDSAEIVLASRNTEDERRVNVHLSGLLGSISSRTVSGSEDASTDETEDPLEDFGDDAAPVPAAQSFAQGDLVP